MDVGVLCGFYAERAC